MSKTELLFSQLIESINALSKVTFFNWAPIVLSAIAVTTAVFIPYMIAKRQNQIAVFDKLFEAYSRLLSVKSFAATIKDYSFGEDLQKDDHSRFLIAVHFETSFRYHPNLHNTNDAIGKTHAVLRENESKAYMIPMLIAKNADEMKKCSKCISNIFEPLFCFATDWIMFEPDESREMAEHLKKFISGTDAFFEQYADEIEHTLLIGKAGSKLPEFLRRHCWKDSADNTTN